MIRWSERPLGVRRSVAWNRRARTGVAGATVVLVSIALAEVALSMLTARDVAAQTPAPRDTLPADSTRRVQTDSTLRDSLVAAQLRANAGGSRRSLFDRLHLDRLRLTELGFSGGIAFPDQVRSTPLYALHANYGEIIPDFRVVVGATYWTSRYTDEAVAGFEQALGRATGGAAPGENASSDGPIRIGRVRSSDVALSAEMRWEPGPRRRGIHSVFARPWLALGAASHFTNVQNPTLDGTFVARALDGVAFGPTAALGIDLRPVRMVQLTAEARYDLFNGIRFGSLRAGGSYVFESRRPR